MSERIKIESLEPCPTCGGESYSQDGELLKQDRVRCDGCKLEFRKRDLRESSR